MYIQVREFGSELRSRLKIIKVASMNVTINDLKKIILDQVNEDKIFDAANGKRIRDAEGKRDAKRKKDEDRDDNLSSNGKGEKEEIRIFFDGKEVRKI